MGHGYRNWMVIEQNVHVGGLAASFEDREGFAWDISGKTLHSRHALFHQFLREMTRGALVETPRKYYVRLEGRDIPCPLPNNLHHLSEPLRARCLRELEEVDERGIPPDRRNFVTWTVSRLGQTLSDSLVLPENRKRWVLPLERLTADWLSEKVRPLDMDRIRENIRQGIDDPCWEPNENFVFPANGGTGTLFEAMARRMGAHLQLNRRVIRIDARRRRIVLEGGDGMSYERLLSTMPIDRLVEAMDEVPDELREQARRLEHVDGLYVGVGLRGSARDDKIRVYVPDERVPFFRVSKFSNFCPCLTPDEDHQSLLCDISHSARHPRNRDRIIEETIEGLVAVGMLEAEDRSRIVSSCLIEAGHSYAVPTMERDGILEGIHEYLEPLGIHSRGRMGAWLHEIGNLDHAVMMGAQWADSILRGGRESVWQDRH
jgi:UDP-galactopyranose mutase